MSKSNENVFSFIRNRPYFGLFALIFFLFFSAQLITELSIDKFELNDFKVYYSAAQSYWNGESVYGVQYGLDTGFYKYSPVILLLFSPFLVFSYPVAATIYYVLNLLVIVAVFYRFTKLIETNFSFKRKQNFLLLLILQLSFLGHFLRELHLGNTNLLLLLVAIITIEAILKNRIILSGLFLSILILTKPYFGLLILPVLLLKKHAVLLSWIACTFALILLSIIVFGFSNAYDLHFDWIISMREHSNYLSSNNTFFSIFDYFFKTKTSSSIGLIAYAGFAISLFIVFWFKQRKEVQFQKRDFIIFFFILLAFFPNFLVTDTEHFLFSFGIITLLALELYERRAKWEWIPYALLIVFYLGEANLFLPREIFDQIKLAGGMGLANIILTTWSLIYLFSKKNIEVQ